MPKVLEVPSLKDYQKEDVDAFGRKIIKTDFGDQSEMERVLVVFKKYPERGPQPMKKVIAETLEARGEIEIVKGKVPSRPTIEEAQKTAEELRKKAEERTR